MGKGQGHKDSVSDGLDPGGDEPVDSDLCYTPPAPGQEAHACQENRWTSIRR